MEEIEEDKVPTRKELKAQKRAARRAQKNERHLLKVSTNCINCGEPLALDQRYCPNCGGKRMYNRITWRNLFEDFVDRFLNIENSFLKTFIALFKKPEDVIVGYMNGMRKKYLPAFNYFAIALTINGIYIFIISKWLKDNLVEAQASLYSGETAAIQEQFAGAWFDTIAEYQSLLMFLTIPILALIAKIVFWNYKKINFVEHLVIQLYSYSHTSIIIILFSLIFSWNTMLLQVWSFISFFFMFGYAAYVLKRVFELDFGRLILKTALFGLVLFVFLLLAGIGFAFNISKMVADGTLGDDNSPLSKVMKEGFERGQQIANEKQLRDSLEAIKNAIKVEAQVKQPVLDTLN